MEPRIEVIRGRVVFRGPKDHINIHIRILVWYIGYVIECMVTMLYMVYGTRCTKIRILQAVASGIPFALGVGSRM